MKGSLVPLEFYTVDMFLDNMYKKCFRNDKFDNSHYTKAQKKKKRVLERMKRNKLRKEIFEGKKHIADLFITDKEIVALMEIFTKVFLFYFYFSNFMKLGRWDLRHILVVNGLKHMNIFLKLK